MDPKNSGYRTRVSQSDSRIIENNVGISYHQMDP